MSEPSDPRADVVRFARLMRERGLAIGTSGNISIRLEDGRIAVTPSSMDYEDMTPADIVDLDARGRVVEGDRGPSSENSLHLAIYAARSDVSAIVHTHSPFAMAFAAAGRPLPAAHYIAAMLVAPGNDTVRIAPYATFGTEALARNVVETLAGDEAALIANHGAVAVGTSLTSAFTRAERIEELATIAWRAEALGGARPLDADELDRVRDQMGRYPRQTPSDRPRSNPST